VNVPRFFPPVDSVLNFSRVVGSHDFHRKGLFERRSSVGDHIEASHKDVETFAVLFARIKDKASRGFGERARHGDGGNLFRLGRDVTDDKRARRLPTAFVEVP
jgi:hypothetical protein